MLKMDAFGRAAEQFSGIKKKKETKKKIKGQQRAQHTLKACHLTSNCNECQRTRLMCSHFLTHGKNKRWRKWPVIVKSQVSLKLKSIWPWK